MPGPADCAVDVKLVDDEVGLEPPACEGLAAAAAATKVRFDCLQS
jgi:hypothetical protein